MREGEWWVVGVWGARGRGGCWPKRHIAVLTVSMPAPKSLQFSVFFSSGSGRGEISSSGGGKGAVGRNGQRPPAFIAYLSPPHPVGDSRDFCQKRGFRKSPLRGGGRPGRQHIPPTPPASPVEPERGQGGIVWNFKTPQITERLGLGVEPERGRGGVLWGMAMPSGTRGVGLESGNKKSP